MRKEPICAVIRVDFSAYSNEDRRSLRSVRRRIWTLRFRSLAAY